MKLLSLALTGAMSAACALAATVDSFADLCTCDLTGACDINCCCDSACTADDILTFSSCLDEGKSPPIAKMCVERPAALEEVNLRYPLRLSDAPEDQLHDLLCVEKDNSAVKGSFFEDQGHPLASQVFSPGGHASKQAGFHSYPREATSVKLSSEYRYGDPILAYDSSDQTLALAFGGQLIVPTSSDGGACAQLNAVSFGKSEAGACVKNIDDLATDCETQFSTGRYIYDILVAQTKGYVALGVSPQTAITDGALLPIRIEEFTDSRGNTTRGIDAIAHPTRWDDASSTCTNALKRLAFNIRYNHTKIVDISVEVEATDVEGDAQELVQEFAVNFVPAEVHSSEESDETNNTITRIRSGNPGYINGKPVLGATTPAVANQTASYVNAQRSGFTVMDTGVGGQCSSSSPTGSVVGFSTDMFVGCTQSMTRDELKEFCTSSQHPMLASRKIGADHFVFPKVLEGEQDLLGIFGNADPMDRRQWIKIYSALDEPDLSVKSRRFVDIENRCVGMPSRLRYEILWTHVGNVENPQAKILSAKKSFEDGPSLQHMLPSDEKQPFSFVTTVSWTYLQPEYEIAKSPPPVHIFSVPHDVFYPFQMNSGERIWSFWPLLLGSIVSVLCLCHGS